MDRNALLLHCRQILESRSRGYRDELASLDEAAAGETKSSAGDKYETAREMIAQSRNLIGHSLGEAEAALQLLERMTEKAEKAEKAEIAEAPPAGAVVGFGSLVETTSGWYLVGVSLGEVEWEGSTVKTLTMASPLGQAMRGKAPGERVSLRGREFVILSLRR